jgi:hypothetical protein
MPQVSANPESLFHRWFKDIFRRLHALEVTVPIGQDSNYVSTLFDTASTSVVGDGVTTVGPVECFGNQDQGTNVEVTGACQIGLDSIPAGGTIGGAIFVQVDGGLTYEPGTGPGIYYLARLQLSAPSPGTGLASTVAATRVIEVLTPSQTQGLSQHTFAMMFVSTYGQTVHFEARILTVNPQ